MNDETKDNVTDQDKKNDYEDICYICRRPESKAGKMIHIPNNICICSDCMQKTFDTMNHGNMPYMDFMTLNPGMMNNVPPVQDIPKSQKLKKKKEKKEVHQDVTRRKFVSSGSTLPSERAAQQDADNFWSKFGFSSAQHHTG